MSEIPQSPEPGFKNPETKQILNTKIPGSINAFITAISTNELSYSMDESLGDKSIESRNTVVKDLEFLKGFLIEYSEHPQEFGIRAKSDDQNSETYRINLGRGLVNKANSRQGEDQVSLIYRRPLTKPETRDKDIYIASLSGKPADHILDQIYHQEGHSIQINFSHIYSDGSPKLKVEPHAGIVFNFSKSGPYVFGLSFIGAKPAYSELPRNKSLNKSQFIAVRDLILLSKKSK